MHCDFCEAPLASEQPANIALLTHIEENRDCGQQFGFMLENLRSSWTRNMSGG